MSNITGRMADLGRGDRFYINQGLRDEEWKRAKQPPWLLTLLALPIVGVAFVAGVYGSGPSGTAGWAVGISMILIYEIVARLCRELARRHLRHLHGH